jgi:hypothetical protein
MAYSLQRRRLAIQFELHLGDLRKHHRPLRAISKEEAAAARRKSGVQLEGPVPLPVLLPRQNDGWMVECLPN